MALGRHEDRNDKKGENMGKDAEEARANYTKSAADILVDAFNEGYRLGLEAATQIYK